MRVGCSAFLLVAALCVSSTAASERTCETVVQKLIKEGKLSQKESKDFIVLCGEILKAPTSDGVVTVSVGTNSNEFTETIRRLVSAETISEDMFEHCHKEINDVKDFSGRGFGEMLLALGQLPKEKRPRRIALGGFRVMGDIDLTNDEIPFEIKLENAIFCGHINLRDLIADKPFVLKNSLVLSGRGIMAEGVLNAIRARFKSHFEVEESRLGAILVNRARVGSTLSVVNSRFGFFSVGNTVMERLVVRDAVQSNNIADRVRSSLSPLSNRSESPLHPFPHELFDGYVEMVDSVVHADLDGNRFEAEGPMVSKRASFNTVHLNRSKMFAADFRNVQVSGSVHLAGAQLGSTKSTEEDEDDFDCTFGRIRNSEVDFVSFQGANIRESFFLEADNQPSRSEDESMRASSNKTLCLNETQGWRNTQSERTEGR